MIYVDQSFSQSIEELSDFQDGASPQAAHTRLPHSLFAVVHYLRKSRNLPMEFGYQRSG